MFAVGTRLVMVNKRNYPQGMPHWDADTVFVVRQPVFQTGVGADMVNVTCPDGESRFFLHWRFEAAPALLDDTRDYLDAVSV